MSRIAPLTEISASTKDEVLENRTVPVQAPSVREIFDTYAPFIWRTLRHLGISERDVEDVCQDVFVTVHRKRAGFEGRSTLRTWLYGICLRTASDHRRRAHVRREEPVSEPPTAVSDPTQFEDAARRELRGALIALLDELDEDKRAVFVLHEIEELSMKEIAEIVECPLQTAYSRLRAARTMLRNAWLGRRT
jgi:RNA polymerase sigma-70 factor (ECF subfamily)